MLKGFDYMPLKRNKCNHICPFFRNIIPKFRNVIIVITRLIVRLIKNSWSALFIAIQTHIPLAILRCIAVTMSCQYPNVLTCKNSRPCLKDDDSHHSAHWWRRLTISALFTDDSCGWFNLLTVYQQVHAADSNLYLYFQPKNVIK